MRPVNKIVSGLGARPAGGFYQRLVMVNVLVILGSLTTGGVAFASPGDLDSTFDEDGKLTASFGHENYAGALILQPGGKTVVGGDSCQYVFENGSISGLECESLLVRYQDDGSLDTDFGQDGRAALDIGTVSALITQSDGRLVSAGKLNGDFALARHEADGTPDADFGQDSRVVTDFGDSSTGNYVYEIVGVAVQPDGKIVVAGRSGFPGSNQDRIVLARYEPDGSLDASFGEGGKMVADFAGGDTFVGDLALLPDGGLVVAGSGPCGDTSRGFVLAGYNADGSPNTGFGDRGKACTVIGKYNGARANSVVAQPDGKIVAAGNYRLDSYGRQGLVVARYKADGTLDTAFGTDGKGVAGLGGSFVAKDVTLLPDGEIAVSGGYGGENFNGLGLARYKSDGTVDNGFGNGGAVSTDFSGDEYPQAYEQMAEALAFQADGKLVAAGFFNPPCGRQSCDRKIAVARYDATPGIDGPTNTAPVAKDDRATSKKNRRIRLDVLRNDSDPDGDRLTVARSTGSRHGSVRCADDGACVYVPDRGYCGRDTFTYVAKDGRGGRDAATVRLRIERGR